MHIYLTERVKVPEIDLILRRAEGDAGGGEPVNVSVGLGIDVESVD